MHSNQETLQYIAKTLTDTNVMLMSRNEYAIANELERAGIIRKITKATETGFESSFVINE